MKNKIIGILGVLFVFLSMASYFAYSNTLKNNSELFGQEIMVLNKDIKAGETLSSSNIEMKKVKRADLVTNYLTKDDFSKIDGKIACIDLYKNEQITVERIMDANAYLPITSKDVSIEITGINALSGNVIVGDIVDIWSKKSSTESSKELSNIRVVGIKDAQNQDIGVTQGATPTSIIIRVDNDEQVSKAKNIGTAFITKSPNQISEKISADETAQTQPIINENQ